MVPNIIHLEMIIRKAVVANTVRVMRLVTLFTAYFLHLQLVNWVDPECRNEILTGVAESRCERCEQKYGSGGLPQRIFRNHTLDRWRTHYFGETCHRKKQRITTNVIENVESATSVAPE